MLEMLIISNPAVPLWCPGLTMYEHRLLYGTSRPSPGFDVRTVRGASFGLVLVRNCILSVLG